MSWRTESGHMKTLTYTVHASREQAERWEAAAAVQGRMAIGAWLAATADAYLRELAKAGRPRPLAWYRGRFVTTLLDKNRQPYETDVPGMVSSHFGIFRGDNRGLGAEGCFRHSLVHLPTRRIAATLPYQRACKGLAAELLTLRIDWNGSDPETVIQGSPDQEKAQALLRLFEKLTKS